MFDQERGEKCGWCNAQDKKLMPCAKLDEVGRRIVLRTDREACKLEIYAHYPDLLMGRITRPGRLTEVR